MVLHGDQMVDLSELVHMDPKLLYADSLASAYICPDEQDMFHGADSFGCGYNALNHTEPEILLIRVELNLNQMTRLHNARELHQNGLLENEQDAYQDHEKDQ